MASNPLNSNTAVAATSWNDYNSIVATVSRNTVDRLKRILRYTNDKLYTTYRHTGLKASLIDNVRLALEDARRRDSLRDYGLIRHAILNPDTITSVSVPPPTARPHMPPYHASTSLPSRPGSASSYGSAAATSSYQHPSAASSSAMNLPVKPAFTGSPSLGPRPPPPYNGAYPPSSSSTSAAYPKPYASNYPSYNPPAPQAGPSSRPGSSMPIEFRSNAFYTIKNSLSSAIQCPRAHPGDRKSVTAGFQLSPEQREWLSAARQSDKNPQYQVRVFCCSESYYSVPLSSYYAAQTAPSQPLGPAPVEFPLQCELKINDCNVGANLRGVKKKEGTTMPPDLGAVRNPSTTGYALDLSATARNIVDLVYINTDKRFFLLVCLVQFHSVGDLIKQVKAAQPKSKETVIDEVKAANDDDDDIVATSSALSLRCPLSFMRLKEPIRSKLCTHIQCFEASTWLAMNEQTPTFNCPQCNKVVKIADLFIDEFTLNIISTVPDKYDSVIVEPDATWYTEDMKFGTSSKVGQPPSAEPKVKAEDDGGNGGVARSGSPEKPKREMSARAVQSLDSDDDNEGLPAAPRPSSQSRPPARRAPPPPPPAGRGQVIDLTLSDSDDDHGGDGGPAAAVHGNGDIDPPASPAVQAPNGSPHKRPRIQDDDEDDFVPPTNRPRLEDSSGIVPYAY